MTTDEQFAASVRYGAVPVCLIRCPSGMIAVTSGFNPRDTFAILSEDDVIPYVLSLVVSEAPPPPPDVLAQLDPFDI